MRWCDRHGGIGADGVLVLGASDRAPVSMRVINADGSEAEMCGNGVRCVARYLDERGEGAHFDVDTIAGIIHTRCHRSGDVYLVRVNMGLPRISRVHEGEPHSAIVDTGNPHVVLFREDDRELRPVAIGEATKNDPRYPDGINVHFVEVEGPATLARASLGTRCRLDDGVRNRRGRMRRRRDRSRRRFVAGDGTGSGRRVAIEWDGKRRRVHDWAGGTRFRHDRSMIGLAYCDAPDASTSMKRGRRWPTAASSAKCIPTN